MGYAKEGEEGGFPVEDLKVIKMNPRIDMAWKMIRATIERGAPVKLDEHKISNIRTDLINGVMSAWLFGDEAPMGVAVTEIREDKRLDRKEVLIFAAANLRKMTTEEWDKCFAKMRLHGLSNGCTHMTCYTVIPRIMEMAKRMGGDVETRYVSIPLGG